MTTQTYNDQPRTQIQNRYLSTPPTEFSLTIDDAKVIVSLVNDIHNLQVEVAELKKSIDEINKYTRR